jgi:DNA primase
MSSSSVEKIKERLDVVEVVGSYIKLDKAGASFKGKCPFHNEKTPSFFVSPSRGSFYCFGCGAKGDMFTFVQDIEGVDFVTSLKLLAERAGVTLESYNLGQKDNVLYDILEEATSFFEKGLKNSTEAKNYLKERAITEETVTSWRIGFVPDSWRLLTEHLRAKGIKEEDMVRVGLVKKSEKGSGDGWYDVFRNRIVFPIFDQSGRPIAFSGRLLGEDEKAPKYLNSPETELFNKSETLYGLDRAKMDIRKKGYAILVEGQFDLIACHQAGFANTVASSGTAFTEAHLRKLVRLSRKLMFAFDSDSAGILAAEKSASLALALAMEVKIVSLPLGKDPADVIQHDGEIWKERLRSAKHIIDFELDRILGESDDERKRVKEIERKVLPYVALLESSIEQSHFVNRIAKKTRLREESLWNDLRKIPRTPSTPGETSQGKSLPKEEEGQVKRSSVERRLVGAAIWLEEEKKSDEAIRLRARIVSIAGEDYVRDMFKMSDSEKSELLFEIEAYYGDAERLSRDLEELLSNFEEDVLKERFTICMQELQKAEEGKDEKRVEELLAKCHAITAELTALAKKKL